jgi:hypothetical protein
VVNSGAPGAYWADSVVELDAATLRTKTVINLNDFEAVNDPDGAGYDSNVADIAWAADGTMYIVDAGGNDLLSRTPEDGLQLVTAWPDNPVPTSIEIAENGDIYIGFLGAGLAPGAGKIERWSGGELAETFSNLNTVTDILLDGDTLYAVQMVIFGEQGPGPGSVVTVSADGVNVVADGLLTPVRHCQRSGWRTVCQLRHTGLCSRHDRRCGQTGRQLNLTNPFVYPTVQ